MTSHQTTGGKTTILELGLPGIKEEDLNKTKALREWVIKNCPRVTEKYKEKLSHEHALEILNRWPATKDGKPDNENRAFVKWLFSKMENWPTTYVYPGKTFLEWAMQDEFKWRELQKQNTGKKPLDKYSPPDKPVYEE